MHGFKSAILAKIKNCQNGTFEPVHEIQNFFGPKAFFWSIMKMAIRKFFRNMSQGLPNPGFMHEKVQKGNFLKKDSRELKFFSCFRFLWISRRPGTLNWERVVFLPSKNLYRKCVYITSTQLSSFQLHNWGHTIFPMYYVQKFSDRPFVFSQKLFWTASWKKVSICGWILFRETKKRLRKLALTQSIQSPKQA